MSDRDIYVWGLSLSVFMLLATVVFSSCRKEETDPVVSVGNVRFAYNWGKLPAEIKSGEGMSLRFYGADGQVYDRQSDTVSFSGELPEGTYRVLLRNRPTPGIGFRGDDCYETAEAYLTADSRAAESAGQPGWLFVASLARCEVSAARPVELSVVPRPMVHRIAFSLKITGRPVEDVSACLLNVATTLNLSTGKPVASSGGEVVIPVERTGGQFAGQVRIFGLLNDPAVEKKNLKLTIRYADNTDKTIELDISDQLDDLHEGVGSDVEIEVNVDADDVRWTVRIIEWKNEKGPDIPVEL